MKIYKPIITLLMLAINYHHSHAQWEMLSSVYTTEVFVKDTNIFIGTDEGDIYLSTDFGQSWKNIKNNLPNYFIDNIGICEGNKLICSTGKFVYTSSNWTDWEKVYEVNSNITAMAIKGDSIYIGAEYHGGVHASFDNGLTWSDISDTLQNRYITSVTVEDTTLMISVFADPPQIFRFNNTLSNWELFNVGTELDQIYTLGKGDHYFAAGYFWIYKLEGEEWIQVFYTGSQVLDFAFNSSYICAAGEDVYISSTSGLNWNTIETTYTDAWLKAIEFYDGYILAGNYSGLYRYPILEVSSLDNKFVEELNIYPNPCSGIFNVKLASISNENILINLLSSDGSLIQSSLFEAEAQCVHIDASDVASGLYILQIIQGEFSVTRRIVIK